MQSTWPIQFLLALVLAASLNAAAQSDNGATSKVLALEKAWNQAEEHKDARSLDALLDTLLVYVDYDGSLLTKGEFLAQVRAPKERPELETTESMSAVLVEGMVVVTGVYSTKGATKGKPYQRRGRFMDTWALKNGGWVCITAQSTPLAR